jgi:hypothetical protein
MARSPDGVANTPFCIAASHTKTGFNLTASKSPSPPGRESLQNYRFRPATHDAGSERRSDPATQTDFTSHPDAGRVPSCRSANRHLRCRRSNCGRHHGECAHRTRRPATGPAWGPRQLTNLNHTAGPFTGSVAYLTHLAGTSRKYFMLDHQCLLERPDSHDAMCVEWRRAGGG